MPDAIGATADFSNLAGASLTHHIDLAVQGPFTVGTLNLASSVTVNYCLENGSLIMNNAGGAIISVTSTGNPLASMLASSLTLQLNAATLIATTGSNTTLDVQAQITGTGLLTKSGLGTLKLSDATNNWSGGTQINQGTVSFGAAAFGTGDIAFAGDSVFRSTGGTTLANDLVELAGVSTSIRAQTGTSLSLTGTFAALGGAGTAVHFGSATDKGTIFFASSSITANDAGSLAIDGGTLRAGAAFASFTNGLANTNIAAGAVLDANGFYLELNHLTGAGLITNDGASDVVANVYEAGSSTFSGVFANSLSHTGLNKIGTGTLTLSGANTYSGTTTVAIGTLRAGADHAFSATSVVDVKAGATLNISAFDQTIAGLTGSGEVRADTVTSATLTTSISLGDVKEFAGVISNGSAVFGELNLIKSGVGTQILSGLNTYTGHTTITAGTLVLSGSGSIADSSGLAISVGAAFDLGGLSGNGASVEALANAGTVSFGGEMLHLVDQSAALGGTYIGSGLTDGLHIDLDATALNFSLSTATFTNWADFTDEIAIVGNGLANTITGSSHADTIGGGLGNDVLIGGGGEDNLNGGDGSDTASYASAAAGVIANLSNHKVNTGDAYGDSYSLIENLTGSSHADQLYGNDVANILDGGAGADTMQGGIGNDTYYVDNAGDHVIEVNGQGTDNVQAYVSFNLSGQELENLQLRSAASINGTGNSIANVITGNSGNNIIDGLLGADTMSGSTGNDTYYVDNAGDHVIEANGGGTDNVQSYVSFNLSGQELENLALRGGASINGTGNSIANIITGNSGNNIIDGLLGADTMSGAQGNDTYYVDNAGDHVIEVNGQGTDNVQAYVSFNLSGQELENLALRTGASINGTGNSIANIITGNSGNNIIDGLLGADTMSGAQGNDTYYVDNAGDHVVELNGQGTDNVQAYVSFNLSGQELENLALRSAASINGTGNSIANTIAGNSGANIINGLLGNDTLSGSTGNDTFVFTTALNASTNVDHITDFSVVEDTIQVDNAIFAALGGNGTLTAAQFVKNTTGLAGDGNDHIIYETDTGWLTYDSNGNAAGGSTHFATLAANLALTNADFVVV
ncbi:beta strand repeat-containing protein [Mesorhizobium kowhaii]|uniref:beta strand repeat-containing protein n=2 Tax=Mesorhizobium kowhaii TaxID=1300272 RepID=UPI003641365A